MRSKGESSIPMRTMTPEEAKRYLVMRELKKRGMNRKQRRDWYRAHHAEVTLTKKET